MSTQEVLRRARPRGMGLALAAVGIGGFALLAVAQVAPAERDTSKTVDQVRIMARVLEDSLDASDVDGWRRLDAKISPFRATVRAQYIPTVGAIFTVPVDFLLNPPDKPQQPAEAAPQPTDDLWERNAGQQAAPGEGQVPMLEAMGPQFLPEPDYDAAKVEALRKALVDALAKYGYRMDSLPPEERVIVLVEAPGPKGPVGFFTAGDGRKHMRALGVQGPPPGRGPRGPEAGAQQGPGTPPPPPGAPDVPGGPRPQGETGPVPPPTGGFGGGAQGGPGMPPPPFAQGQDTPRMPAIAGMGGGLGPRGGIVRVFEGPDFLAFNEQADHLMIALPKSALAQATTADALTGQITEIRY